MHQVARDAFFDWRNAGSPRGGPTAVFMRWSRTRFKHALRQCKLNEGKARALAIAKKYKDGYMKSFWSEIKSLNGKKARTPQED